MNKLLDAKQITRLKEAVINRSLLELKNTFATINKEDLPEAYTRVAYDMCPPSKRVASKFNLEKLEEVWDALGIPAEHIKGVTSELSKILGN